MSTPVKPKLAKTPKAPKVPKAKKKKCAHKKCKRDADQSNYCRLHYLQNWRKIRLNERIKAERRLNSYIDHLAKRYPKDFLEVIKEGIEDLDKFRQTLAELDEGSDSETEREFLERFSRKLGE